MPSPFPGMNPYLEREEVWHDFHERFIPYAAAMLAPQVRPRYIVKLDEHVYIHELPARERRLIGKSDVSLIQNRRTSGGATAVSQLAPPAHAKWPTEVIDEERLSFIEIRDRDNMEIVTVIELLSPSNKTSNRKEYVEKRRAYVQSGIRLVEIDLLRGGPRMPIDAMTPCDYYVLVTRPEDLPDIGVWPINLRDALPNVAVPLREPQANVALNLKQLLDRIYDDACYGDYVYETPPHPPLDDEDAVWAQQFAVPT